MELTIKLKDGSQRELPAGSTAADLAAAISSRLAREAVLAKVDGVVQDLNMPLPDGAQVEILTINSPDALDAMRHTAAHVMAQAVCRLFPGTKLAIGPSVKDGFYYDFAMTDRKSVV